MKTTDRKVVNKNVAQMLRDMGHNDFCDCYLHTDNGLQDDYEMWAHQQHCNSDLPDHAERIAAPYVTDALLWLMQYKDVTVYTDHYPDEYQVDLYIGDDCYGMGVHTDYQDALSEALDELAEKLTKEEKTDETEIPEA